MSRWRLGLQCLTGTPKKREREREREWDRETLIDKLKEMTWYYWGGRSIDAGEMVQLKCQATLWILVTFCAKFSIQLLTQQKASHLHFCAQKKSFKLKREQSLCWCCFIIFFAHFKKLKWSKEKFYFWLLVSNIKCSNFADSCQLLFLYCLKIY